jgi:hypothetical protein
MKRTGWQALAVARCCAMAAVGLGAPPVPASASAPVTVQLWLTPDLAGASAFADAVATPGNPPNGAAFITGLRRAAH